MSSRRENAFSHSAADRGARARLRVFARAREGVLALDRHERILDFNPAAERILGAAASCARGAALSDVFPGYRPEEPEIAVGDGVEERRYAVDRVSLDSRGGVPLGFLAVLRDITGQKRAQQRMLAEESALATMRERDRLARELHDSLGQVLGYVKMQARAARELLKQGRLADADACLSRMAAVAQDAHADVHEYILGARPAGAETLGFEARLEAYIRRFSEHYGIRATLDVTPAWMARSLDPAVQAQLLRMVQEALSNVRKHARARAAAIRLEVAGDWAQAVVQDDGAGFDPALLDAPEGQKFGLCLMRERAQEVGGTVRIVSAPGEGTRVVICVPAGKENG